MVKAFSKGLWKDFLWFSMIRAISWRTRFFWFFEILDGLFVGSGEGLFFKRQHQGMTTTSMMIGAKSRRKNERLRDYLARKNG